MSDNDEVKTIEELFQEDVQYFEKNGANMSMRQSCHNLDEVLIEFKRRLEVLQRIRAIIPRYINHIQDLDNKVLQLTSKIDERKDA